MREAELHGQTLRVGDKVALAFGSGNRDWRKFPDPDVYDIDRRPQGHLGFGAGKHFCLGSQMARLVTETAMKRFLARVPDYHLTVDQLAWNSSSNFRSPVALPFRDRLSPRAGPCITRERSNSPPAIAAQSDRARH